MPPPINLNELNEKKGPGWLFVISFKMLIKDPKSYIILILIISNIYFIRDAKQRSDQIIQTKDELYERVIEEIRPIRQTVNSVKQQVDTTTTYVTAAIDSLKSEKKEVKK